jgi:hypothetical protein
MARINYPQATKIIITADDAVSVGDQFTAQ